MKAEKTKNLTFEKAARLTALFSSFMFLQFVVLRFGNQAGRGYLAEQRQETVYGFLQAFVLIGFLLHAFCKTHIKSEKAYKAAAAASAGICLICAQLMLFFSPASVFYLAVTAVGVLAIGFNCGAIYCYIANLRAEHLGICIGVGYGAAVILQYFLQLKWTVKPLISLFLFLSVGCIIFLIIKHGGVEAQSEDEKRPITEAYGKKPLFSVIITFALLLFTTYYNSYIHHLQIASGYTEYNVYSRPRLLMIPGMLIFGFIGDYKEGKGLPISTLCFAVIALLNAALIGKEAYFLNMCLYYLAMTAVIVFYHLTFLRLAAGTKHSEIWASMGRMLDSGIIIVSFIFGFADFSQLTVFIIDLAALIVIIVLMAVGGDFNLSRRQTESDLSQELSVEELKEQYKLTPTEFKVLQELVQTDDKQEAIAARLNISVSTLRHHITSIYKKTGTQTRSALCKLNNPKQ